MVSLTILLRIDRIIPVGLVADIIQQCNLQVSPGRISYGGSFGPLRCALWIFWDLAEIDDIDKNLTHLRRSSAAKIRPWNRVEESAVSYVQLTGLTAPRPVQVQRFTRIVWKPGRIPACVRLLGVW